MTQIRDTSDPQIWFNFLPHYITLNVTEFRRVNDLIEFATRQGAFRNIFAPFVEEKLAMGF
jgi:hypothetical protein